MKLSTNNFLSAIKTAIMGGGNLSPGVPHNDAGYLTDVPLPPFAIATTGTRSTVENGVVAQVIVLDADGEDAVANFAVPRDYDEATDHLEVMLLVSHVSGTSVDVGATEVGLGRPGSAYAAKAGFTAPTATTIAVGSDCVLVTADLSALSHLRGDVLTVNFAASGVSGAGVAHVLGAQVTYRSTLVSYNREDTAGVSLR